MWTAKKGNFRRIARNILTVSLVVTALAEESHAFVHRSFWVSANYNFPRPSAENMGGLSYPGFGVTQEFMFTRRSGIEFGILYEPQFLNDLISDNMLIPIMYRYWFAQYFSISLGGYYTSQFTEIPIFLSADNFGLRAAIDINLKITKSIALALEAGYQYGLTNLSLVEGADFAKDQAFGMVGFRFGGVQTVTKVTKTGMRYQLDRPPEYEEPMPIPEDLLR